MGMQKPLGIFINVRIFVYVTIFLVGRHGRLDQSEAYDIFFKVPPCTRIRTQ